MVERPYELWVERDVTGDVPIGDCVDSNVVGKLEEGAAVILLGRLWYR